jgi:hypothetical protein
LAQDKNLKSSYYSKWRINISYWRWNQFYMIQCIQIEYIQTMHRWIKRYIFLFIKDSIPIYAYHRHSCFHHIFRNYFLDKNKTRTEINILVLVRISYIRDLSNVEHHQTAGGLTTWKWLKHENYQHWLQNIDSSNLTN